MSAGQSQDSKLHNVLDGTRRDDRPRSSAMREISLFSDGRGRPSLQKFVHFDDKYDYPGMSGVYTSSMNHKPN